MTIDEKIIRIKNMNTSNLQNLCIYLLKELDQSTEANKKLKENSRILKDIIGI